MRHGKRRPGGGVRIAIAIATQLALLFLQLQRAAGRFGSRSQLGTRFAGGFWGFRFSTTDTGGWAGRDADNLVSTVISSPAIHGQANGGHRRAGIGDRRNPGSKSGRLADGRDSGRWSGGVGDVDAGEWRARASERARERANGPNEGSCLVSASHRALIGPAALPCLAPQQSPAGRVSIDCAAHRNCPPRPSIGEPVSRTQPPTPSVPRYSLPLTLPFRTASFPPKESVP